MRVVFYDDPESDSNVWEADLPILPRIGEMVSYHAPNGDQRIGKVVSVEWALTKLKHQAIVEIVLDLM